MRKLLIPVAAALLLITGILLGMQSAQGQAGIPGGAQEVLLSENQGDNLRQISAPAGAEGVNQPNIGFIDSPSATCYQPDVTRDTCFINWYYASVSASPNYMITMTIALNEYGQVARTQGFFQTSMYIPYNMLGQGFKVACGAPTNPDQPDIGKAYGYTIRARDSAGLKSANYGTAYCPSYNP